MWCILFYILSANSFVCSELDTLLVNTVSGTVRGHKDENEDIYVFYGIPYAKAPTGLDRFKAPLPPPIWNDPLDAFDKGIICPQVDSSAFIPQMKIKIMQEDCLIANVYVPNTEEKNLPVVVYIHGGGFLIGYGDLIPPKKIVASKRVIVVNFNYRLGPHGFLCLGTKEIPGNGGMKDQVQLLRWVKSNIANFGGNPNDVTIIGCSSGSSSVDLLIVSKMAKGLFNKAILESGAGLSPFSVQVNPILNAREYGKIIGYHSESDVFALQDFYKYVPYDVMQSGNLMNRTDSIFLMAPCVERDIGEERFFDDSPLNILNSGNFEKLPMLYGFANMEGIYRVGIFKQWKDLMNEKFADFLPGDLKFKNDEEREMVAANVKKFYFGEEKIDDNNILDYINYFTDMVFACPTLRSIKLQVEAGNNEIYLYEYSYVDDEAPNVPHANFRGANHCAQSAAVLDGYNLTMTNEEFISDDTKRMKKLMREIWLNFMTNGKPHSPELPAWMPVKFNWAPHMALKKDPELKGSLLKERCFFWEEIYNKYYNLPSQPPHVSPKKYDL